MMQMAGTVLVEHVLGRVVGVFRPGEYTSTVNNQPVQGHVVVLDTGHSFVFDANAPAAVAQAKFHELSPVEAKYALLMANAMGELSTGAARMAGAMRVPMPVAMRIMVALHKTSLIALQTPPRPTPRDAVPTLPDKTQG